MKNKKVYASPDVKGIYVLQSLRYQSKSHHPDEITEWEAKEKNNEEERLRVLEIAKDEAYKKGRLDAEQDFKLEMEKIKSECASLTALFQNAVKEALSHVSGKKIVAVRISPDDAKKINLLEEIKWVDQNIKILEDGAITSGGCVIETDFGSVDCQIETRWEEIRKALVENKNESAVR